MGHIINFVLAWNGLLRNACQTTPKAGKTPSCCRRTVSDPDSFVRQSKPTYGEQDADRTIFQLPFGDPTHSLEEIVHAVLLLTLPSCLYFKNLACQKLEHIAAVEGPRRDLFKCLSFGPVADFSETYAVASSSPISRVSRSLWTFLVAEKCIVSALLNVNFTYAVVTVC